MLLFQVVYPQNAQMWTPYFFSFSIVVIFYEFNDTRFKRKIVDLRIGIWKPHRCFLCSKDELLPFLTGLSGKICQFLSQDENVFFGAKRSWRDV